MVNSEEFSIRLQKIMEKHDLNASSFAEKINVGRSSISHILSGRNKPSLDFVLAVLKTFDDVDLYWLLNGRGTFPKSPSDSSKKNETSPAPEKISPPSFLTTSTPKPTDERLDTFEKKHSIEENKNINKGKKVTKVILLYDDGTFENFIP
jgi:transcriptional regulator with XRE-family HTH domain